MNNFLRFFKNMPKRLSTLCFVMLLAQSSTNYKLQSYGFGSGGTDDSTSANYGLNAISGETSENQLTGGAYLANPGLEYTQMSNVPNTPTLTNPSNWYDKLNFIIDNGNNPTDTTFVIAISTDNFVTTNYIQIDDTIGASPVYQTYTNWGGGSGETLIGLMSGTTYKIKVKAMQGKYSESGYGPVATAATVDPSMDFDIDVSASDTETDPPYLVDFGDLSTSSINTAPQRIWIDFSTNADWGGYVYVYALNTGLKSDANGYTVPALTTDLSSVTEGFGAQIASMAQSSGGPLSGLSPYNGASNNVGITDTTIRGIFTSSGPITAGRGSFILKAKISTITPAANDYTENFTAIASAGF